MYLYETSMSIQGTVSRWPLPPADRILHRARALDSLILSRLHSLAERPSLLLMASADAQKPPASSLFSRTTILNSLVDFWNAILKEPFGHACFAQLVDQLPGQNETSRVALEQSLSKVKPYEVQSFESLLERIEKVSQPHENQALLQDNLGRFLSVGPTASRRSMAVEPHHSLTCVEAFIETHSIDHGGGDRRVLGRDFPVTDFRESLNGIGVFFQRWNAWLIESGLKPAHIERIYLYSHLRNLLPVCWDELRQRGVAADQIRLPQWSGLANALSGFLEFLLSDAQCAQFLYFPMNGRCHMAHMVRL